MQTVYDWITLGIFAGLIVLFLQRSSQEKDRDRPFHYLIAGGGCALVNYLGNKGMHMVGLLGFAAVLVYIQLTLKPLGIRPR